MPKPNPDQELSNLGMFVQVLLNNNFDDSKEDREAISTIVEISGSGNIRSQLNRLAMLLNKKANNTLKSYIFAIMEACRAYLDEQQELILMQFRCRRCNDSIIQYGNLIFHDCLKEQANSAGHY